MSNVFGIVAVIIMCTQGVAVEDKCSDGNRPDQLEVDIMVGTAVNVGDCAQGAVSKCVNSWDSVYEIRRGSHATTPGEGTLLFQLRPDGTTFYAPGYTPDEGAKAFNAAIKLLLDQRK